MKTLAMVLAAAMVLSVSSSAWAGCCGGSKPACKAKASCATVKAQDTCPVMGGKVNKDHYVDYNGKRVYFCCGACPAEFNKDPEQYMKKLADEGVTPEDTPKAE